jgi:hypothetical protein
MIDTSGAIGYESARVRTGTWMQLYRTGLAGAGLSISGSLSLPAPARGGG